MGMPAARPRTLLATHTSSDLDGFAALVALRPLFPEARILVAERVQESVADLLHELAGAEYLLREADLDPSRIERLVVADTADLSRLGRWTAALPATARLLVFDHHPPETRNLPQGAELDLRHGEVGSVCTLVTEYLQAQAADVEPRTATLLLAGLFEDTGQLAFRSTRPRDFTAGAALLSWGADPALAARYLQRLWDARRIALVADLRENARLVSWGNLRALLAQLTLPYFVADVGGLASELTAEGADAAFLLAAVPDKVFIVGRSLSPGVSVAEVMQELGGGGHETAASAVLTDTTLVEAEAALRRALDHRAAPLLAARDIMSRPILSVDVAAPIADAHRKLSAFRIGSLVVTEKGAPAGIIDADAAALAVEHGVHAEPVRDYARALPDPVDVATPLHELRALLYRTHERFFVVYAEGEPAGVVTRRDVLRAVYEQAAPPVRGAGGSTAPARHLGGEFKPQLGATVAAHLRQVGAWAGEGGCRTFLVGGGVRDLVLRRKPTDLDLVVDGETGALLDRLRDAGAEVKVFGRYHTAHVAFADGTAFDLARARRETYARPGALPEVVPGSLEQDLFRRDFTMNALAVDLSPDRFGQLFDRFGGLSDLKHGRIRVLHSLSFVEDPTRAFRAMRLAVRFGFSLEDQTRRLLERAVALDLFRESEGTRLRRELVLIFEERDPLAVLHALEERGILRATGGLAFGPEEEARMRAALEWMDWYRVQFGGPPRYGETLMLGMLTAGMSPERGRTALEGCKVPGVEIERWEGFRQGARDLARFLGADAHVPSAVARRVEQAAPETLLVLGMLHGEHRETVTAALTRWPGVRPGLSGDDLMALGIPRGPELSAWTRRIRDALLDGRLQPGPETERAWVRERLASGASKDG